VISDAYKTGVHAAIGRLGIKESSVADVLIGGALPFVTRAGLRNLAPNLVPTIDKHLDTAFQGAKRVMMGPRTPAEALTKALSRAPIPEGGSLAQLYHERAPLMRTRR